MTEELTTAQAAFVVDAPLDIFRKTVDKAPVKWRVISRGGRRERRYRFADLIFLKAYAELTQRFTAKGQTDFYQALSKIGRDAGFSNEVAFGHFRYDISRHLKAVEAKLKELGKLRKQIEQSDGDALIKGTRIEAHRIAALLDGGMTVEEVLRDYPSLKEQQVLAAKAYAEANPKRGRPYPRRTAKSAMRAADLSALDDED